MPVKVVERQDLCQYRGQLITVEGSCDKTESAAETEWHYCLNTEVRKVPSGGQSVTTDAAVVKEEKRKGQPTGALASGYRYDRRPRVEIAPAKLL